MLDIEIIKEAIEDTFKDLPEPLVPEITVSEDRKEDIRYNLFNCRVNDYLEFAILEVSLEFKTNLRIEFKDQNLNYTLRHLPTYDELVGILIVFCKEIKKIHSNYLDTIREDVIEYIEPYWIDSMERTYLYSSYYQYTGGLYLFYSQKYEVLFTISTMSVKIIPLSNGEIWRVECYGEIPVLIKNIQELLVLFKDWLSKYVLRINEIC